MTFSSGSLDLTLSHCLTTYQVFVYNFNKYKKYHHMPDYLILYWYYSNWNNIRLVRLLKQNNIFTHKVLVQQMLRLVFLSSWPYAHECRPCFPSRSHGFQMNKHSLTFFCGGNVILYRILAPWKCMNSLQATWSRDTFLPSNVKSVTFRNKNIDLLF